ncbi:MAG TPA: protein kinase, partial [Polyangiaceae bacterium]|nr:protein kinase [Polyangiaceae bacterium]
VLKRLNGELARSDEAVQRFLAEARVAARLHHANVVGTHQIDWDEVGPFIVLDYVEGGSLSDLVDATHDSGEKLPVPVVLRMALDVLAALSAVHEAKDGDGRPLDILHRDVSLENILIGVSDGVARLSDFGVAKSALGRTITDPGCFVGKVLYFAPEYLLREPVGTPLDLYALGVTLWLALTGDELWPGRSDGHLARAIVEEGVPSLDGHRDVAPAVRDFVARACARDPRARFQSAREMAAVLQELERHGAMATHAEVAACVERLLGERLRERRAAIARLAPELAGTRPSTPLELRQTVRDPHPSMPASEQRLRAAPAAEGAAPPAAKQAAAPAPKSGAEPRRVRTFIVPAVVLALIALATGVLLRSPEPPPGAPELVANELPATPTSRVAAARPPEAHPPEPVVIPAEPAPPPRTSRAPAHRRAPQATRLPPAPAPAAVPAPLDTAPSGIARKNPYR